MKVTAAYIRVSSQQWKVSGLPTRNGQEQSLPKQREYLTELYKKQKLTGDLVFFQDDRSGADPNRPGFKELKDWIESDRVQNLLAYDDSRLSRNEEEFFELMFLCWHRRVEVYIQTWGGQIDWGNPPQRTALAASSLHHAMFIKRMRSMSKDGKARLLNRGEWVFGKKPYGFRKGPNGHLEPYEPEWSVILLIFKEIRHSGMNKVARRLEAERIAGKNSGWHGGQPWTNVIIHDTVTNPVYAGAVVWNQIFPGTKRRNPPSEWKIYNNAHKAAVTWDEYWEIQQIIHSRVHGTPYKVSRHNPFAGLIYCGHHRRVMGGFRAEHESDFNLKCKIPYCPNNGVPIATIEPQVLSQARAMAQKAPQAPGNKADEIGSLARELKQTQSSIQVHTGRLARLEVQQSALFKQFGKKEITTESVRARMDVIGRDIEYINKECGLLIARQRQIEAAIEHARQRLQKVVQLSGTVPNDDQEKRDLLRRAIKRIDLFERSRLEVSFIA